MNLHEKIIAIAAEAEQVRKDGYNQHLKYKFHSHGAVTAAVRDLLIKYKVATETTMREGSCVVTLVDAEGEGRVESSFDVPRPSDQPQSTGIIMSYAVKLCYQKVFMLEDETQDAETVKKAPAKDAPNFDADLTALASVKTKQDLDAYAQNVDQFKYSKSQWEQLVAIYKEKLNAIDNSHG